ncbi:MAG: PEPxxWA-CTERM sorting domain-containing protein [Pseudomonadota bacterium]
MRKVTPLLSALAAASVLALGAGAAQAATTLSVGADGCGKSTCFNDNGVFSQSWSAKDFSGPVTIGQLLLDRGVLGSLDGSTFQLSFALNGETLGTWGQYTMAGIGGDWLTFGGENFVWNPEDGDLVLILSIIPPPKPGAGGGFFASSSLQAGFEDQGPGSPRDLLPDLDGGRLTAPIPEPGAWALMITGFGLAGAAFRQRRRVLSASV